MIITLNITVGREGGGKYGDITAGGHYGLWLHQDGSPSSYSHFVSEAGSPSSQARQEMVFNLIYFAY